MVAGTDLSDLRKLTVVKLRDRLAKLGLSTSGLKADLVERLFKHYKEQEENDDNVGAGGHDNMDTNIPPPVEAPRTALQLRMLQMAGQPNKEGTSGPAAPPPQAPSKPPPQAPMTRSQPPSLLSQPVQPPRSQMMLNKPPSGGPPPVGPPPGGPPSLLSGPPLRPPGSSGPPSVPPPGPPPGMQSQQPPRPPTSQPMGQPPQQYGGPPPPQQMNQSHQPMGNPPQMVQPTPPRPQIPPPPPHMMLPPPVQEPDLQEKIAMQTRMLEQERQQQQQQQQQQQEQQQRMAEQQQKERLAIQQQAMLLQQQNKAENDESNSGLMEKVRQQQMMLEQQKQKERLEQQQQAMMEQQNQAIKQQEEERRRKEAELLRQQQMALMEAQRDEQQKQMREDRGPPRQQRPPIEPLLSQNAPFNPRPNMPHGAPRGMIPPPTSSYMPPHSSSGRIPPLLPPDGEPIRPPRRPTPPDRMPEKEEPKEMKLAPALEKVLAFKDVRAQEVGLTPEEIEKLDMPEEKPEGDEDEIEMVEMEEEDQEEEEEPGEVVQTDSKKESKNKRRKKKKKKTKKHRTMETMKRRIIIPLDKKDEVQIEYVQEQLDLDPSDPNYFTFSKIFEMFKISEEPAEVPKVVEVAPVKPAEPKPKGQFDSSDEGSDDDADMKHDSDVPKLSKKKLKKLTRLSVAQLKQLVSRPDVVEMHDVTAQDPRLCVHLKATRNTVPVPRHWCFKRKYLQGKRGIEKPPFELPDYIQATGITEMRAALAEKEDQKNLKAKMREKVRPKMGKIDIDYQKLHDAFFRWQTKPKMTIHGDLYYEGKEFETRLKEKKPGNITDDLKTALGMPIGPGSEKVPPPWLIAMQRYGPPPSYPNLKIAGLNAPIPEACTFGYHAGGWGKPPVDENGKPLYGDVFGTKSTDFEAAPQEDDVDQSHWGELESESESEEESSEEEEEEGPEESGLITPAEGLVTPSGITSIPVGMETPDMIELRKRRIEDAMDQGGETPALYQVLPEKKAGVGGAMMGSAHIYDVPGLAAKKPGEKGAMEGVEIALNPEELDLDTAAMQAKYDQTIREQQSQLEKEDLSDMVAEHAAKQKKRKKKQEETGKGAKKYKEFKF